MRGRTVALVCQLLREALGVRQLCACIAQLRDFRVGRDKEVQRSLSLAALWSDRSIFMAVASDSRVCTRSCSVAMVSWEAFSTD